jgi:RNA polymerase sigma factor (sigma-70 family)
MSQKFTPKTCVDSIRDDRPIEVEKVINFLYQRFKLPVTNYIYKQGGSEEDCDDIFQEVILVFVRQVQTFRFEATTFSEMEGYFIRIARYKWLKKQESEGRRFLREQDFVNQNTILQDANALGLLIEEEERLNGHQMLEQLGEKCKAILLAFYGDKQSLIEIANQLGMASASLVKAQKFRIDIPMTARESHADVADF